MTANDHEIATAASNQPSRWSLVWIVPLFTLLMGGAILFWHYSVQGPEVRLLVENAEGIQAGKTLIKSRSVAIGSVESVTLAEDLHHVEIKVRLNSGMEKLLHADTLFWIVKPYIGREGVTGLSTLLSGAYIELQPGRSGARPAHYSLLKMAPYAAASTAGIRVTLVSAKAGQLTPGDPVLFRGYRVGRVEKGRLDTDKRRMLYQLFIAAPYDRLVTANVHFWKESGIAVAISASGMRIEMGSLTTLLSGGVSFDVPEGWERGEKAADKTEYLLFDDRESTKHSLYTTHIDYLLFFTNSVRGLQPGAPVEFRGVRLGTVDRFPLYLPDGAQDLREGYRVPVLIRIEPDRFINAINQGVDAAARIREAMKRGLHAKLKTGNLLSGSLYIDLDFYPTVAAYKGPETVAGYKVIPTLGSGLNQLQQKLLITLDKLTGLPLNPLVTEATGTLRESGRTMQALQSTLRNINALIASPAMRQLPLETQQTLREMARSLKGLQPGSPAYATLTENMQQLDRVLRELQPVLKTLNKKSNSLILEAQPEQDPQPEKAR